jgi:hypothetical protein
MGDAPAELLWFEVADGLAERSAAILGASSGAAKAVAERNMRLAAGEPDIHVFLHRERNMFIVGPIPHTDNQGAGGKG